ncbi:Ig-like domain-containing protein [Corallococcus sp. BB11-1]|uniref:Ig-like domain-containing protein n=1 Tax=Corallococcus sp. BB11-1 TaxID=2996783 RepID=UPI002271EE3C|nr:Ig-like domain-containing protein [Corallococcus sp. BB11-1]MCY1031616.1 Ig-like domain-containing protein [Corallococcus sp. BB11-1]
MKKTFVVAVVMGAALVTGCGGAAEPSPERQGAVATTRQALLSSELEASLSCVQEYVDAGTCDWPHWSELWQTCQTYEHPELEDGLFLDEVKAGRCTSTHWPTLRAQLIASHAPRVRVRVGCDGDSAVMQEAELDGCYTLGGTDASFVEVPFGKTVTLHAAAGCAGESTVVQYDTSLCGTSFPSGASANENVRSFRVQSADEASSPASYVCAANEPTCVRNFNSKLGAINTTHTAKVIRVVLEGRETPSIATSRSRIQAMYEFFAVASHNQVHLQFLGPDETVRVTSSDCETAKGYAVKNSKPNAFLNVYLMPLGMCASSRASAHRIYLNDGLMRTYYHETGHVLGLAHGNRLDATGDVDAYGDASTNMGRFPSDNYNLPQLHWLGWTKKADLIKVNPAIEAGGSIEVTLRPVDNNADSASPLPLGAVWESPDSDMRLFVAVPKSRVNSVNQIGGGGVFVYRAPKCEGCTGMAMGTLQVGRFGPKAVVSNIASDLLITPVRYESHQVMVNGTSTEVFTSVTLRIKRSPPTVLTPAAGSVTSDTTPTYSGRTEAGFSVAIIVDGVKVGTTKATAGGTWSFTPTKALTLGVHTVKAWATDAAGNNSPNFAPQSFTVATSG